jgi:hypothetical protein
MASPGLVAPTLDELTYALARMTPDRLRALLKSYVENVTASGSPIFDANCLFGQLPQATYLLEISTHRPECKLVSETGRLHTVEVTLGIIFLASVMLGMPLGLLIFNFVPGIEDLFFVAAWAWGGLVAAELAAFGIVHIVRRMVQRRIVCPVPNELHKILLSVLVEVREKRRSWIGIKIAVKLVGLATFDPIAHALAGDEIADVISNFMDGISDNILDAYVEKGGERLRDEVLSRFPSPIVPAGIGTLNMLAQHIKIIDRRAGLATEMRHLPYYRGSSVMSGRRQLSSNNPNTG